MKKSTPEKYLRRALFAISIVYLMVLMFYLVPVFNESENALKWNEIGDAFGSLNVLFTALAFAFLIYTSVMQKEELEHQREELRLTRDEIKKSAEAQAELVELTRQQVDLAIYQRRLTVQPKVLIQTPRFLNNKGSRTEFEIKFPIRDNPMRILEVSNHDEIRVENKQDSVISFDKRIDEGKDFFFTVSVPQSFSGTAQFFLKYRDIDGNNYEKEFRLIRNPPSNDLSIRSGEPKYLV